MHLRFFIFSRSFRFFLSYAAIKRSECGQVGEKCGQVGERSATKGTGNVKCGQVGESESRFHTILQPLAYRILTKKLFCSEFPLLDSPPYFARLEIAIFWFDITRVTFGYFQSAPIWFRILFSIFSQSNFIRLKGAPPGPFLEKSELERR